MKIDELKQKIEEKTGVPASLLNEETEDEILSRAGDLLKFKNEIKDEPGAKTAKEAFSEWFNNIRGFEPDVSGDAAEMALAEIREELRLGAGGYPSVNDAGEVSQVGNKRPAREQFSEWFGYVSAFDPRR